MNMSRREFAIGTGALIGGQAFGSGKVLAQTGEPLTFMTPFGFIPDFLPLMNMVSGGFLAKQGFAPKLIGGQGTATAIQQLLGGQVSFVYVSALDEMLAVAKQNASLLSVSTLVQGSTFQLVSLKDKPIKTAQDMKGKTVGIVSVGGATEILLNIALAKAGMKADDIKREVTGNSPAALQLVRQGRIDCFFCAIGVVVTLKRANEPIEVVSTDTWAPMPSQIFLTTKEIAASKPEMVVRFLKALKGSCDEIMSDNVRRLFERASKDYEIVAIKDLDAAVALIDTMIKDLWLSEGKENLLRNVPRLWKEADASLRSANLAAIANVEGLYTNEYIDRALKG
jgi:ABC-type nitrate/sulfonate/bicarbonate transport system substrate-binding protein